MSSNFHVIIHSQSAVINAKTNIGVTVFYAKWQQLITIAIGKLYRPINYGTHARTMNIWLQYI